MIKGTIYMMNTKSYFHFFLVQQSTPSVLSTFSTEHCGGRGIGPDCNISNSICDLLDPCRNNGTCYNNTTTEDGYNCSCSPDFTGLRCEIDNRPCQPIGCWNNGRQSLFLFCFLQIRCNCLFS